MPKESEREREQDGMKEGNGGDRVREIEWVKASNDVVELSSQHMILQMHTRRLFSLLFPFNLIYFCYFFS